MIWLKTTGDTLTLSTCACLPETAIVGSAVCLQFILRRWYVRTDILHHMIAPSTRSSFAETVSYWVEKNKKLHCDWLKYYRKQY